MTSTSTQNNPKQFLYATISKEWNRNIQIYYLDTLTNEIHITEPARSTIISNLTNYPKQFLIVKEEKNIEDILSSSATQDIRVINFETTYQKNNSTTPITRATVSNPRKDIFTFNYISDIVEEMEKNQLDTILYNRLQEILSPKNLILKNPTQLTSKIDQ